MTKVSALRHTLLTQNSCFKENENGRLVTDSKNNFRSHSSINGKLATQNFDSSHLQKNLNHAKGISMVKTLPFQKSKRFKEKESIGLAIGVTILKV